MKNEPDKWTVNEATEESMPEREKENLGYPMENVRRWYEFFMKTWIDTRMNPRNVSTWSQTSSSLSLSVNTYSSYLYSTISLSLSPSIPPFHSAQAAVRSTETRKVGLVRISIGRWPKFQGYVPPQISPRPANAALPPLLCYMCVPVYNTHHARTPGSALWKKKREKKRRRPKGRENRVSGEVKNWVTPISDRADG